MIKIKEKNCLFNKYKNQLIRVSFEIQNDWLTWTVRFLSSQAFKSHQLRFSATYLTMTTWQERKISLAELVIWQLRVRFGQWRQLRNISKSNSSQENNFSNFFWFGREEKKGEKWKWNHLKIPSVFAKKSDSQQKSNRWNCVIQKNRANLRNSPRRILVK